MKASSKKRRSRAQINEEKLREEKKQAEIKAKLAEFDKMRMKISTLQQMAESNQAAAQILNGMVESGNAQLDGQGNVKILGE